MVSIQLAQRADLPALQKLAVKVYRETFAPYNSPQNMEHYLVSSLSLLQFEKEFEEEGSTFYLAKSGTALAGYAKLRKSDEVIAQLGPNTIEMQRLYVDIPYQSKKVGALLMKACLDFAKAHAVEWIWLGVWEKNFKAQQFYKKWGFEKFDEHIFQMGDDPQTDWLMKKQLREE